MRGIASSRDGRPVPHNDEVTPELPRRVRGLTTSRWLPGGRASPSGQRGSQGRQSVLGHLTGRATSVPFTTVLTGSERTTTDNATAHSTSALPRLPRCPQRSNRLWEQGVPGSNPAVPTTSTNPLLSGCADGPSLG